MTTNITKKTTITSAEDVESDMTRTACVVSNASEITPQQLEKCLSDTNYSVVLAAITRKDIKGMLTAKQIEDGLNHKNGMIRAAFVESDAFQITAQQLARCLNDKNKSIVCSAIHRKDNKGMLDESKMLNHESDMVRIAFVASDAFTMNPQQLERCLNDKNNEVIFFAISRKDTKGMLTAKQIKNGLNHESDTIRIAFLKRDDITLTKGQINRAMNDISNHVRAAAIIRNDCILNQAQINSLLKDDSPLVRLGVIRSPNIVLTQEQINIGLNDKEPLIREACKEYSQKKVSQIDSGHGIDFAFKKPASNKSGSYKTGPS